MDYSYLFSAGIFVQAALLFYVAGFLVRDELLLRLLILTGTIFYILYYYNISDNPLWDAIFGSSMIGAANSYTIFKILHERSTIGMSAEMRKLYAAFPTLSPGQFRAIMKIADQRVADTPADICIQGEVPECLYLISDGVMILRRDGKQIELSAVSFVGEISFLLEGGASANVTVPVGTEYLAWPRPALSKLMNRSPALANAMSALFNRDIARKLASSWPDQFR